MILSLLTWIFCFYASATISSISDSSSKKSICFAIIYFAVMCILIVIRLIMKSNSKNEILNIIFPFVHFMFYVCHFNVSYGYGNTLGILGYSKIIGLFSVFKIKYNFAFILLILVYTIMFLIVALKIKYIYKKRKYVFLALVIGSVIEVVGSFIFVFTKELSPIFMFSIICYWIVCISFNLISRIKQSFV